VCALHCVRAVPRFRIVFEVLSISVDTTFLVSRVLCCIASALTTLAVSAVAPS